MKNKQSKLILQSKITMGTYFFLRVIGCTLMILVLYFSTCFATTGDILYQNCVGSGCTGAGSGTGYIRTVETSGCLTGSCLKFDALERSGAWGTGSAALYTGSAINGQTEITVVYSEKFSKIARSISGGNIKSIRPYINGSSYVFATVIPWFGRDFYQSYQFGTITFTDAYTPYVCSQPYHTECVDDNGNGTYSASHGRIIGNAAHATFGTTWVTVRQHIKLPTTTTSEDGAATMWINGELAYSLVDGDMPDDRFPPFTGFSFYPSSEASEDFDHWMDDMVIYEGYVSPTCLRADVNQDSQINTTDAQLTLRNSLGLSMDETDWEASATTGDVNCDSNSNSTDAVLILRYSLGLSMSGTGWCAEN